MPSDFISTVAKLTHGAFARVSVKSALNPFLWMCAVVCPICFIFSYAFRNDEFMSHFFAFVGTCPILLTLAIGAYFAIKKPDKLQSEDYQLRQQTLNMIEEKGARIVLDRVSLEEIANPAKATDSLEAGPATEPKGIK